MTVGVVAQQGNERARALADELATTLGANDIEVWIDSITAEAIGRAGRSVESMDDAELVASIGGDGTFLFSAKSLTDTPIVGINLGEVGFLNAVSPADATSVLEELYRDLMSNSLSTQTFPRVTAAGSDWTLGPALNEITVHAPQRGPAVDLSVTITVNDERFTTDLADGVIVATPTGSTAYNLSENGPLLTPDVPGLVITEMCGRESMPSTVIPLDSSVSITLDGVSTAAVISDGRNRRDVSVPTTVTIRRADNPLRVAGPPVAFFEALGKLT